MSALRLLQKSLSKRYKACSDVVETEEFARICGFAAN